jgi:transaldolase
MQVSASREAQRKRGLQSMSTRLHTWLQTFAKIAQRYVKSAAMKAQSTPEPTQRWKSPLHEMTQTTATCLWSDSAALDDLQTALEHGAVGATCNPVIALGIIKSRLGEWRSRIASLSRQHPAATEDELAWKAVEWLSTEAAALLAPAFAHHRGRNGRLSIQTDPRLYRDVTALVRQAQHFDTLAPNMIVKIPATRAGIAAIEESTALGISINATVSFSLPQCVAVAEAVERGLERRAADGHDTSTMGPVCTIMVGRLDDALKAAMERDGVVTDPCHLEWAGVAVFKKSYEVFRARGYRTRLLSAAFRHHMHWSELVGGDVVVSPPPAWQRRFFNSDLRAEPRMQVPVQPHIIDDLYRRFEEFRNAYDEDGLTVEQFDGYAATRRTLRQFLAAGAELSQVVRDVLLPNPDGIQA